MEKYIVSNSKGTKGILVSAEDSDKARAKALDFFYSPYPRNRAELCVVQVYEKEKHLFVSVKGNKIFDKVQFHSMGGVTTTYNATIDTEPTQDQLNFLGKEIVYIKFFDGDN